MFWYEVKEMRVLATKNLPTGRMGFWWRNRRTRRSPERIQHWRRTLATISMANWEKNCTWLKVLRLDWLTESFSKECWCCACCSNGIVAGEPALRKPHCARTCSFPCAFFCWSLFQILFAVLPIGLAAAKIMKIINPEGSWLNLPTSTVHKWCYYNATDTTVLTITV